MRSLLFFLIFLSFSFSVFSQNYSEKYNKLYDRYDFIDSNGSLVGYRIWNDLHDRWDFKDSNGRIYGYRKYSNLYKRWDYVDLSHKNTGVSGQRNHVINYGQAQSTFDADLAIQALAIKQARYNSMTPEQRRELAKNRKYQRSREWVISNSIKWYRKTKRIEKKMFRSYGQESRKLKRQASKPKIDISTLSNGWYEAIEEVYIKHYKSKKKKKDGYVSRFIYIYNGKPMYYINQFNIILSFDEFKNVGDFIYAATASNPQGESSTSPLFYVTNKSSIDEPQFFQGTRLYFYTQDNIPGDIVVDVIDEKNNLLHKLPVLDKYFPNEKPNCKTISGVSSVILPPGKYYYYARTKTKLWRNEITIKENKCHSINLSAD